MKRVLVILAVIAGLTLPSTGFATSGGLDRNGGHYCRTRCEAQGYRTGYWHQHRYPDGSKVANPKATERKTAPVAPKTTKKK